jgi:cold-inducible RNA-binding protein
MTRESVFVATRIYVGNLPYSATTEQLTQLFTAFGDVTDATIIVDRDSGRSKGFGFVEMADGASARTAIAELNGTMLDDRAIRVSEAQARADRSTGQNNRPRGGTEYRDRRG